VLLRRRPDGSAAADRVAALLPAAPRGWVPPEEDEARREHPAEAEAEAAAARSWGGRCGAHGLDTPRWRLDPGLRGAVALVAVALLAAVVAGGVAVRGRPQEVAVPAVEAAGVPLPGVSPAAEATGEVVVAVAGRVRSPGLVRLPAGSRVDDAVRAAGGPVEGADPGLLNLARRLVDGEQVLVGVDPPAGSAAAPADAAGGLLDLNAATVADLDALPGIGPVLAQRIVDWRTGNGRFASVDQLREVTGIGEAKYRDLEAKVTV
jgi:competence protein ComEA